MHAHSGRVGSVDAGLELGGAHRRDYEFDEVGVQSDRFSDSIYEDELHYLDFIVDDDDLQDTDFNMRSYIPDFFSRSEREFEDECNDFRLSSTADATA